MFGLGMMEIMVIFLAAFLVLKPEDLPKFFRGLGRVYAYFREMYRAFMREINLFD